MDAFSPASARSMAAHAAVPLPIPDTAPQQRTVMVVDDDPQVLSFLKSCLETVAGHRVMGSPSAAEAVEICAGYCGGIHLLITDVNLAVSQGIGLARQACALRPGMRVLFISGADNAELVANGLL